jgi:hypothetical protein
MKLFMGVCNSQAYVPSNFFWSFCNIRQVCKIQAFRSTHPWDVVRNNQAIDAFLKSDCEYFVKMDVDQIYPPDYFEVMVPLLEKHDIIGPMIYDRHMQNKFMPLCFEEDKNEPVCHRGAPFDNRTGILEVEFLHTNCFFNRYAIEAVDPPWYEAYLAEDGLERRNHVDFDFMQKFRDKGFKIYVNFDMVVKHIAQIGIDREFYERWNDR